MSILALLIADRRGTVFVKFSSLALLIAIAAIILLHRADAHFLN